MRQGGAAGSHNVDSMSLNIPAARNTIIKFLVQVFALNPKHTLTAFGQTETKGKGLDPELRTAEQLKYDAPLLLLQIHVSYSLNTLKGVLQGIIYGSIAGVGKGDTRSSDYSSCRDIVGITGPNKPIIEKHVEKTPVE